MKAPLFLLGLSVSTALLAAEPAAPAPAPSPTPAPAPAPRMGREALPAKLSAPSGRPVTDEELLARRGAATAEPIKVVPPKVSDFSIRAMSMLLAYGDKAVLLPKGCVLWCPDALQSRVVTQTSGTLTPWAEFLPANRNWLGTFEVTSKQARGEEPIPEKTMTALKARNGVVVATLNGLPVTVLSSSPSSASR